MRLSERTAAAEVELLQAVVRQAEEVMTGLVCMQVLYPSCSQPVRQVTAPRVIEDTFRGTACLFPCVVNHFKTLWEGFVTSYDQRAKTGLCVVNAALLHLV